MYVSTVAKCIVWLRILWCIVFVGYWPDQNAVVVAHQGTNPTQLSVLHSLMTIVEANICIFPSLSDLTDVDIITENLNSTLFPGVSTDIYVHSGFANEQAQTATAILAETKKIIQENGATSVILVCFTVPTPFLP